MRKFKLFNVSAVMAGLLSLQSVHASSVEGLVDEDKIVQGVYAPQEIYAHIAQPLSLGEKLQLAKTCKSAHAAVDKSLCAARAFYEEVVGDKSILNNMFTSHHPYKKKGTSDPDHQEAFRVGFLYLVFGVCQNGVAPNDAYVTAPTYKMMRWKFKDAASFPNAVAKLSPEQFKDVIPTEKLIFSYETLFNLYHAQSLIGSSFLASSCEFLEHLMKYYKDKSTINPAYLLSRSISLGKTHENIIETNERAHELVRNFQVLAKYTTKKNGDLSKWLDEAKDIKSIPCIQLIPINLSTYQDDIEPLFSSCERIILEFGNERWERAQLMNAYLSIG